DAFGPDGRGRWARREESCEKGDSEARRGEDKEEEDKEGGVNGEPSPTGEAGARKVVDGEIMYRRRVIPGYGHLDTFMGRYSWREVYPSIREEIDRVVRGPGYRVVEPRDRFARMVAGGELVS